MALEKIEALVDKWNEQAALPEIAMARKVSQVNVDASYFQVVLAKGTGKRILDEMRLILDEMVESFETDGNIKGVHLSEVVAKAMVDQETGERGFLITGREEFLEPYERGQELFKVGIRGLYELNSNAYDIADMKRNIDEIEKLTEEWIEKAAYPEIAAREMMNKHPETLKDVAALLISETGKNILDQIRREFDQFIEVEQNLTAERQANAAAAAFTTKKVIIIVTTASIVFGGLLTAFITLGITKPIRKLVDASNTVGKGDLTAEVKIKSRDEIGQLAVSFNRMVDDLKKHREHLEVLVDERTKKLKDSHSLLNDIIEGTTDIVFLKDSQYRLTMVNSAIIPLFRMSKEDIIGKNNKDLLPADLADQLNNNDNEVMTTGETKVFGKLYPQKMALKHFLQLKAHTAIIREI